ncbi:MULTISPECIES: sporulation phosphorelay system protein KapB [Paenibacillus]|uniref:sporulation phosphorelay system protein KapB n=1 Tax=Paenibacillus TaxID=44249 RepID=UPI000888BF92|nr:MULTISPECIES: sporulation phosphorelay system protein KapB [Paenibacillus]NTZ16902.1 kinase [Paenibacillus sp. JMULE4]SDH88050.1 kinase-associated protein B [Paenibacillus naphthalenovorans]
MESFAYEPGTRVRASYKTGEYIGEVVEQTSNAKAAVKILAVVKHPTQGDLHTNMDPDVAFFHQRRALAYQEIALMPLNTVRPYSGPVPDYKESLHSALQRQEEELRRMIRWAERCLHELELLKGEYN